MKLILVMDNDSAIGRGGELLCRLPEDMKRFREVTKGSVVIVGRKTYESFPKRPLPNRENLVLSRSLKKIDGAEVFSDVDALLKRARSFGKEIFVIGGAEVYRQLLPYCTEALITRVYENFGGDAFFEEIERDKQWVLEESSPLVETGGRLIRFFRYKRCGGEVRSKM